MSVTTHRDRAGHHRPPLRPRAGGRPAARRPHREGRPSARTPRPKCLRPASTARRSRRCAGTWVPSRDPRQLPLCQACGRLRHVPAVQRRPARPDPPTEADGAQAPGQARVELGGWSAGRGRRPSPPATSWSTAPHSAGASRTRSPSPSPDSAGRGVDDPQRLVGAAEKPERQSTLSAPRQSHATVNAGLAAVAAGQPGLEADPAGRCRPSPAWLAEVAPRPAGRGCHQGAMGERDTIAFSPVDPGKGLHRDPRPRDPARPSPSSPGRRVGRWGRVAGTTKRAAAAAAAEPPAALDQAGEGDVLVEADEPGVGLPGGSRGPLGRARLAGHVPAGNSAFVPAGDDLHHLADGCRISSSIGIGSGRSGAWSPWIRGAPARTVGDRGRHRGHVQRAGGDPPWPMAPQSRSPWLPGSGSCRRRCRCRCRGGTLKPELVGRGLGPVGRESGLDDERVLHDR